MPKIRLWKAAGLGWFTSWRNHTFMSYWELGSQFSCKITFWPRSGSANVQHLWLRHVRLLMFKSFETHFAESSADWRVTFRNCVWYNSRCAGSWWKPYWVLHISQAPPADGESHASELIGLQNCGSEVACSDQGRLRSAAVCSHERCPGSGLHMLWIFFIWGCSTISFSSNVCWVSGAAW